MNWDNFKKIWQDFKARFRKIDQIGLKEQKLKWAKACMSVRMLGTFPDFKDWLDSLMVDYFRKSRGSLTEKDIAYYAGRGDAVEEIEDQILDAEGMVKGLQINLDALKKKREKEKKS